jgi:type I restriction enzyme R subunit
MINEDHLEQLCLSWFRDEGYNYAYGPDIAHDGETPERADYRQVILTDRLTSAIERFNPHLPAGAIEEIVHIVTKPEHPALIQNNRTFHQLLINGVKIEYHDGDEKKTEHVQLIDFNNPDSNRYLVVNQCTVQGMKMNRRPDIVLFINGLPIAVIELKNPADEGADVWDAYNQLQTYKDEISDLFVFNEALVVSDGWTARIGSLTASKEWFMPWRTIMNENDKPLLEYELEKSSNRTETI